jgi:hypothetical protein
VNANHWLEKAERLRSTLTRLKTIDDHSAALDGLDSIERVAIAHWLRQEFSDEPGEDTQTLPLFADSFELGTRHLPPRAAPQRMPEAAAD